MRKTLPVNVLKKKKRKEWGLIKLLNWLDQITTQLMFKIWLLTWHHRCPSKPNVILNHGLCPKNSCLLKLPWNSFSHTLTSLTVLTPFRLSPESGGLGGVLWSIKLETFKIQPYTDFKKCRNFQRLDLMLFCSVNLQKGSRRFPTSKMYLEWCKQLQKTWLKTQGFHVYLQVYMRSSSITTWSWRQIAWILP